MYIVDTLTSLGKVTCLLKMYAMPKYPILVPSDGNLNGNIQTEEIYCIAGNRNLNWNRKQCQTRC